ncbi:hypothetical protein J0S82_019399, partial [Galemys pyrenaicus]
FWVKTPTWYVADCYTNMKSQACMSSLPKADIYFMECFVGWMLDQLAKKALQGQLKMFESFHRDSFQHGIVTCNTCKDPVWNTQACAVLERQFNNILVIGAERQIYKDDGALGDYWVNRDSPRTLLDNFLSSLSMQPRKMQLEAMYQEHRGWILL